MARGDKTVMFTARITEEQNEFLIELGDGSRTKGFDAVLSQAMGNPAPSRTVAINKVPTTTGRISSRAPTPIAPKPQAPGRFIGKRR